MTPFIVSFERTNRRERLAVVAPRGGPLSLLIADLWPEAAVSQCAGGLSHHQYAKSGRLADLLQEVRRLVTQAPGYLVVLTTVDGTLFQDSVGRLPPGYTYTTLDGDLRGAGAFRRARAVASCLSRPSRCGMVIVESAVALAGLLELMSTSPGRARADVSRTSIASTASTASADSADSTGAACLASSPVPLNAFYEVLAPSDPKTQRAPSNRAGGPCVIVFGLHHIRSNDPFRLALEGMIQLPSGAVYTERMTAKKQRAKWAKLGLQHRWPQRTTRAASFHQHFAAKAWPVCLEACGSPSLEGVHTRPATNVNLISSDLASGSLAKRDLVMAVGDYTDVRVWYRLLRSLREGGAASDVVIFSDGASSELQAIMRRYGAAHIDYAQWASAHTPMRVEDVRRMVKTAGRQRFFFQLYYWYLRKHGASYRRVALFDSRDVIFQRDPFAAASCKGLTVFTETAAISLGDKRHVYFSPTWPRGAAYRCHNSMANISSFPPINSGVLIADVPTMLLLLQLFDCEMEQCAGWDQAVLGRLVYMEMSRLSNISVRTTELGGVAHLHSTLEVTMSRTHEVLNEARAPYATVHAYDRFDGLARQIARRFPYKGINREMQGDVFSHA